MIQDVITQYKGCVMMRSIDITDDSAPSKRQFEIMILRRDLDRCTGPRKGGYGEFKVYSYGQAYSHTSQYVWFVGTLTPKFLDKERLLAPCRKHLRSSKNFEIDSKVKAEIANDESTVIKQERIPDPQEPLDDIKRQKELGKRHYLEGDMIKSSDVWCGAAAGGKPFTDKITELFFQLNNNEKQGTIKVMQQSASHDRTQYADGAYMQARPRLWRIRCWERTGNRARNKKLCYRLAMTHRLADDNKRVAQQVINLAAQACPDDAAIQ
ncbi:uncharacterized protein BHQ10_008244 [Talaromyces amestolkiae]|uniref:Uncharacterized protein n=1 Tax=Talaromyces amestolkiae TaxID=1196081 RepID=A0A364L8U2_TALAM|nr:uncharacterized protein BHQ10_008244 [Talaromyces amestolkiae]RAO72232.1 hypothetical protein BHQ10_008244 [Talaromyces amestolkiae]